MNDQIYQSRNCCHLIDNLLLFAENLVAAPYALSGMGLCALLSDGNALSAAHPANVLDLDANYENAPRLVYSPRSKNWRLTQISHFINR
jgi:hypothetical protein